MYNYQELKPTIFTEDGQVKFLKVRDKTTELLNIAGCFSSGAILNFVTGDTWLVIACIDRLVELGEIIEITDNEVAGQDRIFTKRKLGR